MTDVGRDRNLERERAALVGVIRPDDEELYEPPLAELRRLAYTAGAEVVETVIQKLPAVKSSTFIGRGKAEEVAEICEALDLEVVIFDHDLSPAQVRNLEKIVKRKVIDRSEIILDIFASRARTRQAKVQVELAQLEYLRPRLKRMWTHLSRHEGGIGKGGPIGLRGPGEKQLEVDRRLMQKRIGALKHEMRQIERRQHTRASSRRDYFSISLVGYTNAGKSTLLRALTGAETRIEDKLFATLDTKTRAWVLADGKRVFLSDTVGFIRGLPHHLVASFHATLEEAREADLLLHVVDAANPDAGSQMAAVNRVLADVQADKVPTITILNKVDALKDRMTLQLLGEPNGPVVRVSAETGEGLPELGDEVMRIIEQSQVEVELTAHPGDGRLLAFLADKGRILTQEYPSADEVRIRARLPKRYAEQLPRDGKKEDWEK